MNTGMKNSNLATVIKARRTRQNLTQEHLASLAGVDVRTIQRAERDGSCSQESLMAIAEALDCEDKDLITEAEQLQRKEPPKDKVVRLSEVTNGQEFLASLRGTHASIADPGTRLDSRQLEDADFVFNYMRDAIDVLSVRPLDSSQFGEQVGVKIRELRCDGVICFSGDYTDQLFFKDKPDEPLRWNVQIVAFRRIGDSGILQDTDGKRFIMVTIPGKNRLPTF